MIQQRKKDYLQRLIEKFFAKLHQQVSEGKKNQGEMRGILNDGFAFYADNLGITKSDRVSEIIEKLNDTDFIEQYAKLLYTEYSVLDIKYIDNLNNALFLINHLLKTDATYSWDRIILREDIIRILEQDDKQ